MNRYLCSHREEDPIVQARFRWGGSLLQKRHEKTKTDEDHHMDVLKLAAKRQRGQGLTASIRMWLHATHDETRQNGELMAACQADDRI